MLSKMLDANKIRFIDIEDSFDKDEILQGYVNGKCMTKNQYKKAMEGEDMRISFTKQLSLSAHTWTEFILEPYLNKIPSIIIELKKDLQETELKIK